MVTIGGMQPQHDGSSLCLAWDPRIVVVDSEVDEFDGMASLHMIGCLEEQCYEELTEPR
jgi:hypothetical protein